MNRDLENIKKPIGQSGNLNELEKEALVNSIKSIDKEIAILEFKLQRIEKVKRTTSVLLEETIDELEKKRADVENANAALKKLLEKLKATQPSQSSPTGGGIKEKGVDYKPAVIVSTSSSKSPLGDSGVKIIV